MGWLLKKAKHRILRAPLDLKNNIKYLDHEECDVSVRREGDRWFYTFTLNGKDYEFHVNETPEGMKLVYKPEAMQEAFDV